MMSCSCKRWGRDLSLAPRERHHGDSWGVLFSEDLKGVESMKLRDYVRANGLEQTWIEINIPGKHSRNPVYSGYPALWMDKERPFYMNCDVKRIEVGTFTNFPGQEKLKLHGIRVVVE